MGLVIDPVARRVELPNGLAFSVLEWAGGRADRDHTVLLLHGFLDIAWSFVPVVNAGLAERYHVIAADLRGHGDSDRVGAGGYYHFMDYVADVALLVDALARKRLSVVGHSMGGTVASYYAGAYPERTSRLVLLEGLGPPEDPTALPERTSQWIAEWPRRRRAESRGFASVEEAAERLMAGDALLDRALALELAERGTRRHEDGRIRFKHDPLHRTRGPYPFRFAAAAEFWRRVSCPVLYVEASETPFRLPDLDLRLACFGSVERARLQGAGHMMQRHRPAELARLILEFIG